MNLQANGRAGTDLVPELVEDRKAQLRVNWEGVGEEFETCGEMGDHRDEIESTNLYAVRETYVASKEMQGALRKEGGVLNEGYIGRALERWWCCCQSSIRGVGDAKGARRERRDWWEGRRHGVAMSKARNRRCVCLERFKMSEGLRKGGLRPGWHRLLRSRRGGCGERGSEVERVTKLSCNDSRSVQWLSLAGLCNGRRKERNMRTHLEFSIPTRKSGPQRLRKKRLRVAANDKREFGGDVLRGRHADATRRKRRARVARAGTRKSGETPNIKRRRGRVWWEGEECSWKVPMKGSLNKEHLEEVGIERKAMAKAKAKKRRGGKREYKDYVKE
ncbi:hypothetical protein R3P38DRAFT_2815009 [Favolaschia claudopus]|uniref:Uncharacterized protein n=1 Tax=Favolaschia claudopus TaxID=2862362 RepID=A0AAV9Z261_9AGAR